MQYIGIAAESHHPSNILLTDEPWKGRVLFTGPRGITDHRVRVEPENRYIGIGTMSREGSSEVSYLWRAAPNTPFPRPKTSRIGEVGWRVPTHADWSMPNTGRQIMLGHFRQECEDRYSHLYQNAWYPGPAEEFPPESDAARVMNVYRPATSSGWPYRSTRMSKYNGSHFQMSRTPAATSYTNYYSVKDSYRQDVGEAESDQQQHQTIRER